MKNLICPEISIDQGAEIDETGRSVKVSFRNSLLLKMLSRTYLQLNPTRRSAATISTPGAPAAPPFRHSLFPCQTPSQLPPVALIYETLAFFFSPGVRLLPRLLFCCADGDFFFFFLNRIQITLLPFGAHFSKSCFSSLETFFLQVRGSKEARTAVVSAAVFVKTWEPWVCVWRES